MINRLKFNSNAYAAPRTAALDFGTPSGGADWNSDQPILEVNEVSVQFEGIRALDGVSFAIARGEICGLIGPNGAGKTTMFNCISRVYSGETGTIKFRGQEISGIQIHKIIGLGISRTFQNVGLFHNLNAFENVLVGAHSRFPQRFSSAVLKTRAMRQTEQEVKHEARHILDDLDLSDIAYSLVADLPYGTQKRIELARALISRPQIMMLDEPAGGLTQSEVLELGDVIRKVRTDYDLTILLVEHHMELVMSLSDHVIALNGGRVIADGAPTAVQRNADVQRAYLGSEK